jgi:hypothetical protein
MRLVIITAAAIIASAFATTLPASANVTCTGCGVTIRWEPPLLPDATPTGPTNNNRRALLAAPKAGIIVAYDLGMYCKGCGVSTGGNVPSRPPNNDNN